MCIIYDSLSGLISSSNIPDFDPGTDNSGNIPLGDSVKGYKDRLVYFCFLVKKVANVVLGSYSVIYLFVVEYWSILSSNFAKDQILI